MEREINEISHHVDVSHGQAYTDLQKASQFITEALQKEVQRNMALRMLIHRLEERASENGRSLSEQVESNRQLKVQVDELQKHLEDKDNSLTQANQTIGILKNELRDLQQQLQSHQSHHSSESCKTIQAVTEAGLQDGESQPNVVKEEDGLLQNLVMGIKEEEDVADEDDDGYQCSHSDEADTPTEQTTSSSADIKAELVQEQDEESDMAPVLSSEINQSPPDPASLVKFLRLSVQVVDCCTIQHQQGADGKNNERGEQPKNGRGSRRSSLSAVPKFTAIPKTMMHNEKPYHCSFCRKSFSRKAWLKKHLHVHRGDNTNLKRDQHIDAGETPYHCKPCGKRFLRASDLRRHKRIHKKDKPYHCKQCGTSFSRGGNLKRHQLIHTGERPYPCGQCGKAFFQMECLKRHRRVHTGEKPYRCKQCGSSFAQPGALGRHQRIHTGEKPYQCKHCGKRFLRASDLKRHKLIHTKDKPYYCKQCDKSFSQGGHLRTHQRIHTGDKPHNCKHCGKCFSQAGNLRRHQHIHTGESP
ncbi:hypothetical protein ACEWY4_002117 [Coilia grayii]|uniref:C2H2-type domain-containing protein n=1 Tax=Coilia grayii TaxID=363190 RepID=A0ABD1KUV2_9TELE